MKPEIDISSEQMKLSLLLHCAHKRADIDNETTFIKIYPKDGNTHIKEYIGEAAEELSIYIDACKQGKFNNEV